MKPRRSVLSVPSHIEKMHSKALNSNADVVMLDLEDSVPVDKKKFARALVADAINNLNWNKKTISFRINALDTPFAYRDIIEVVEKAGNKIDSIVIPKVNNAGDIECVSRILDGIEMEFNFKNKISIEASIETPMGLLNIEKIVSASKRIITLVFGIADYSASIGASLISISGHGEKEEEIYPGHRWHFEISRMVMAAKSKNIMVIDAPYGNFKDLDGLKKASTMVAALGCDGKWAIHPMQIDIINEVFSPAKEDIKRAKRVLDAHQSAISKGLGATSLDGRMVDFATIRIAKKLCETAKHLDC